MLPVWTEGQAQPHTRQQGTRKGPKQPKAKQHPSDEQDLCRSEKLVQRKAGAKAKKMMSKKAPSGQKAKDGAKHQKRRGAPGVQRKTCCPQEDERSRPRAPAKEPKPKHQAANRQRKVHEQRRSRPGPPPTKIAKKPASPEQRRAGQQPTPRPEKQQPKAKTCENA